MSANTSDIDFTAAPYCKLGYVLPLIDETNMPLWTRCIMYFIGLIWSFLGVAIVADIFMCAIEVITSKKSTVTVAKQDGTTQDIEVRVWNDTIANLTLMALGSSAPEIILNVIEIIGSGFVAGDLGPGTIVGSAAFNMLIIIGFCIFAIPDGETRRVDRFPVFGITAVASVFAYIWLLFILKINTEGIVELWEAIVTFLFFPILVVLAYMADINLLFCCKRQDEESKGTIGFAGEGGQENLELINGGADGEKINSDAKMVQQFMANMNQNPDNIDEASAAQALAHKLQGPKQSRSRAYYRVQATRMLTAGSKLDGNSAAKRLANSISDHGIAVPDYPIVSFACTSCSVMESAGTVEIVVLRTGNVQKEAKVRYESIDGTATAEEDYIKIEGTMVFAPGETKKAVEVKIIDDDEWEPDETFFVKLSLDPTDSETKLGKQTINQVTIINDDDPGTFEFTKPSFIIRESEGVLEATVKRYNGGDGTVVVKWYCTDMTAHWGEDYEQKEGELHFENGEMEKAVRINIKQNPEKEPDENFRITLSEVSQGAKLGHTKATVVTIIGDAEFKSMVNRVMEKTHITMKKMQLGQENWSDQFVEAMNVNGGDIENATAMDYVMHFLSFGFKTIFAIIPPPNLLGGWPCFFGALAFIAVFTLIISDLANVFGCLVNLKPAVNAITLVAMGTSLPDLFASKTAAVQEEHADNSLGNVTGSNSVNVFLGLGLPWSIAAIYWTAKGGQFEVPPGSLAFSVTLFTVCAVALLALIYIRRCLSIFGKAELGGPRNLKIASFAFAVFLWFFYVLFSALQSYGIIAGF